MKSSSDEEPPHQARFSAYGFLQMMFTRA
jgi:hypothetical protein